jgi:hypothetical protein
MEFICR